MDTRLKVLVIGNPQSGKSCLVNYMTGKLDSIASAYRPTVGARILKVVKSVTHDAAPNGEKLEVHFWDLSGDPKYENCWPACKDGVDGIIMVVNGDQRTSQEDIEGLIRNFPKDMGIKPVHCLGLLHHTSGSIKPDSKQQQICGLTFHHSCIEDGKIWCDIQLVGSGGGLGCGQDHDN